MSITLNPWTTEQQDILAAFEELARRLAAGQNIIILTEPDAEEMKRELHAFYDSPEHDTPEFYEAACGVANVVAALCNDLTTEES